MAFGDTYLLKIQARADQARSELKQLRMDVANTDGAFNKLNVASAGLGKMLGSMSPGAVAGAAATAAVFLYKSAQAATDLSEQVNKTREVFGEAADQVLAFGENTASSLGLSNRAALEATGTFGQLFKATGFTDEAAADMSVTFAKLAADLASFNNTTPEDAVLALGAALRGESEPIRRYGVLLDDATLKAKALELGLYSGKGVLTQSARATAAYNVILEQTTTAQGDVERTSDSLANQQRFLTATVEDLNAKLGEFVVAYATPAIQSLNDLADAANGALGPLGGLTEVVNFGQNLNPAIGQAKGLAGVLRVLKGDLGGLTDAARGFVPVSDKLFDALGQGFDRVTGRSDALGNAFDRIVEGSTHSAEAMREIARAAPEASGGLEGLSDATDDATDETKRWTSAIEANERALKDQIDTIYGAIDAELAYERSTLRLDESLVDLRSTLTEVNADQVVTEEESRKVALAFNDLKGDVFTLSKQYADASGEIAGTNGYIDAQRRSLVELREKYRSEFPEIVRIIDEYLRKLNSIPRRIETTIVVNSPRDVPTNPGRRPVGLAAGGSVWEHNPYIVGEQGPELFVPNTDGKIVSHNETRRMIGGNTNVTVIMPRGVSGREVASTLNRFQRSGGVV